MWRCIFIVFIYYIISWSRLLQSERICLRKSWNVILHFIRWRKYVLFLVQIRWLNIKLKKINTITPELCFITNVRGHSNNTDERNILKQLLTVKPCKWLAGIPAHPSVIYGERIVLIWMTGECCRFWGCEVNGTKYELYLLAGCGIISFTCKRVVMQWKIINCVGEKSSEDNCLT
jgi:hypothetical protein